MNCIWCLSPTSAAEPEEHIVPEGLVGGRPLPLRIYGANPSVRDVRLVLDRGEVCGGCNARNGKLDDAVQGSFGFLKPALNRVGTKSGKPATAARPGMYAERREDGVHVTINATDRTRVSPRGVSIGAAKQKADGVRLLPKERDAEGRAGFRLSQPSPLGRRVSRALHKVAFELVCFQVGAGPLLDPRFNPIRDYVSHGRGERRIAFCTKPDSATVLSPSMIFDDGRAVLRLPLESLGEPPSFGLMPCPLGTVEWVAELRLGVPYYIDVSPGNDLLRRFDPRHGSGYTFLVYDDRHGILNVSGAPES